MPNSKLENKSYSVPERLNKFLGSTVTYANLKTIKTRLNKAKNDADLEYFNKKGGDETLRWADETLKNDRNAIHSVKKTGMDAGRENQFIKTHEKDNENTNVTKIGGLPKITKGKVSRKIMSGKEVYNESISEEIKSIRYLIEYMNNNKKQNL